MLTDSRAPAGSPRARHRGVIRVLLVLLFGALLVWQGPALPANAHARLVSTVPRDTGIVDPTAPEMRLIFNEPVRPAPDGFVVYDAAAAARPAVADAINTDVRVSLPTGLAPGSYLLSWRVVSGDGHVIAGTLSFGYGRSYRPVTPPPDLRPVPPQTVAVSAVVQVAAYLGLLVMAGLVWFGVAVIRGDGEPDPTARFRRRVLRISAGLGVLATALLAPLVRLLDAGEGLSGLARGAPWWNTFTSSAGLPLLFVVAGTAVALVAMGGVGRAGPGIGRRSLAAAGATLALSSLVLVGHTRTERPVWLAMVADLVHVTAAAGWLGGVVALALVLRSRRSAVATPPDTPAPPSAHHAAVLVSRFSTLGAVLVGSLGASGLALAVMILPAPAALITTGYGRALLVKLGLVAVVAALALWNRARLVPAVTAAPREEDRWRRLREAVRDELVILIAIVATTGVLVSLSPGIDTAGPIAGTSTSATFDGSLGQGARLEGSLAPARVGENVVELTVRDRDGALLTPVELPDIVATLTEPAIGPIEATVTELTPGHYRATLPLAAPGRWNLEVFIRSSDERRSSVRTTVPVQP